MASEDATGSAPHALKVGARVLGYEIRRVLGVGQGASVLLRRLEMPRLPGGMSGFVSRDAASA